MKIHTDHRFGFPIYLVNPPMREVREDEALDINANDLRDAAVSAILEHGKPNAKERAFLRGVSVLDATSQETKDRISGLLGSTPTKAIHLNESSDPNSDSGVSVYSLRQGGSLVSSSGTVVITHDQELALLEFLQKKHGV